MAVDCVFVAENLNNVKQEDIVADFGKGAFPRSRFRAGPEVVVFFPKKMREGFIVLHDTCRLFSERGYQERVLAYLSQKCGGRAGVFGDSPGDIDDVIEGIRINPEISWSQLQLRDREQYERIDGLTPREIMKIRQYMHISIANDVATDADRTIGEEIIELLGLTPDEGEDIRDALEAELIGIFEKLENHSAYMQVLTIPVYRDKDNTLRKSLREAVCTGLFDIISLSYYVDSRYFCRVLLFDKIGEIVAAAAEQWKEWEIKHTTKNAFGDTVRVFHVSGSFEVGVERRLLEANLGNVYTTWDTSREGLP